MKLQLITDQGGSIDEYYAACLPPPVRDVLVEPLRKMRALFDHLENNVDGPPRSMTISHLFWFYLSDEDTWKPSEAKVFVYMREFGWEIEYRSAHELHFDDAFTTRHASDEVEAGDIIVEGLRLAEEFLPRKR